MSPADEAEFFQLNAEASANSPGHWAWKAHRLKGAADELTFADHWTVRYMLLGLSIENLLKALAIGRGHRVEIEGDNIVLGWPRGSGHDLAKLADFADFRLDPDELALLNKLTEFIVWGAKYPTPRKVGPLQLEGATYELDHIGEIYDRVRRTLDPYVREADQRRAAERQDQDLALAEPVLFWIQNRPRDRQDDGATLYHDDDGTYPHDLNIEQGGSLISCVSSGSSFPLTSTTPAACCAEGHLHFLVARWDPARDEKTNASVGVETNRWQV